MERDSGMRAPLLGLRNGYHVGLAATSLSLKPKIMIAKLGGSVLYCACYEPD